MWIYAWERLGCLFVDCLPEGSMRGRHLRFPRPGFPCWVSCCHAKPYALFHSLFDFVVGFYDLHASFLLGDSIAERSETCVLFDKNIID